GHLQSHPVCPFSQKQVPWNTRSSHSFLQPRLLNLDPGLNLTRALCESYSLQFLRTWQQPSSNHLIRISLNKRVVLHESNIPDNDSYKNVYSSCHQSLIE